MKILRHGILAFLLVIFGPGVVQAFNVEENLHGKQIRWIDDDLPIVFILDERNISPGGDRHRAIKDALTEWDRGSGLKLLFRTTFDGSGNDLEFRNGDGKNEILFVDQSEIDENAGQAFVIRSCPTCRRIVEVDIAIGNHLSLAENPRTDLFTGCTARGVIIHELGHAIGLDDVTGPLALMDASCSNEVRVRGHAGNVMVLPDDVLGARQQYKLGVGEVNVNLFSTAQILLSELPQLYRDRYQQLISFDIPPPNPRRVLNYGYKHVDKVFNPDAAACAAIGSLDLGCRAVTYDAGAINLCPGESFVVPYTIGNRDNNPDTEKVHSIGFYLSENDVTPPFDPTDQAPKLPPLAGAILDNELEFDSTGAVNSTGVQSLTLSSDPDCVPAGSYRLWHGVDICHQFLEGGGDLEGDNFALTGLFINILSPTAPACAQLELPVSDGICELAEIRKTCNAPPLVDPVEPPTDCPPTGCGTQAGRLCLKVGEGHDGTIIGATSHEVRIFFPGAHPDGDQSPNLYCIDDPEITGFNELVCSGANKTCVACDEHKSVGCSCNIDDPDSCGGGLTCLPSTAYGNDHSFSSARCWSSLTGVPEWECQADCSSIYGQKGYCYHGSAELTPGKSGLTICATTECELACADSGLACNSDTNQCETECFSSDDCLARGYPDSFQCNPDAQRCYIGGIIPQPQ